MHRPVAQVATSPADIAEDSAWLMRQTEPDVRPLGIMALGLAVVSAAFAVSYFFSPLAYLAAAVAIVLGVIARSEERSRTTAPLRSLSRSSPSSQQRSCCSPSSPMHPPAHRHDRTVSAVSSEPASHRDSHR